MFGKWSEPVVPIRIDLVVSGGHVLTMDARSPEIVDGAVAVDEGRIVAVGNRHDIERRFVAAGAVRHGHSRDRHLYKKRGADQVAEADPPASPYSLQHLSAGTYMVKISDF